MCELLRAASKFNGKRIAVRGLTIWYEHGQYLAGEECETVPLTAGRSWPALIWIVRIDKRFLQRGLDPAGFLAANMDLGMALVRARTEHGSYVGSPQSETNIRWSV